ncbi:MAG: ABC transporter permease [Cytophagales bacterium]|nr:ABC transporter permease [Cytophagales bacterium]
MKLSYFISKRISQSASGEFSGTINRIAVGSIAVGLAIMMVAFFILHGFQDAIRDKVVSFKGELQLVKYSMSHSYEEEAMPLNQLPVHLADSFPYIQQAFPYAHKAGLLKTEEEVAGIILKGVDSTYARAPFLNNMVAGEFVRFQPKKASKDIVISKALSDLLRLNVGDEVVLMFVQNPPRYRKLTVSGLYDTGMDEFDKLVVWGDLGQVRKLNHWGDSLAGGVELHLKDFRDTQRAQFDLLDRLPFQVNVRSILDEHQDIFDWLNTLNVNVLIFLILILTVASFNMISIVLILIMERTHMIGVLKALGSSNSQIRNVFKQNGMWLIIKGLALGNAVGLGFGLSQHYLKYIPLDPESYYMNYVPISWSFWTWLLLNVGTFALISLVLFIPTAFISKVEPIKAIRFE